MLILRLLRGSAVCANGERIFVDIFDQRGRSLIRAGGNFNPPALAAWRRLLAEDDWSHVVDVGANYGEMLVNVGLPDRARIIAAEPNRRVLPFLKRTLRRHRRIEIIEAALSDAVGEAAFLADPRWSGESRLAPGGAGGLRVRTTTLGALLQKDLARPEAVRLVLKIDVEGHEVSVLRGAIDLFPRLGAFAALMEVKHLSAAELEWICANFTVWAYRPQTDTLHVALRLDGESLRQEGFYDQDVVIRCKQAVARGGA